MKSSPTQLAIVTGATSGLGFFCARQIARDKSWSLLIAGRNAERNMAACTKLKKATGNKNIQTAELDLESLSSVRKFVTEFEKEPGSVPLKAVICNAGLQFLSDDQRSPDGFERAFAINHLGHFLFVNLLLPQIAEGGRITFVASGTHDPAQKTGLPAPVYENAQFFAHPDQNPDRRLENSSTRGRRAYAASKLCNILTAYELQRRMLATDNAVLRSLKVNAFDPGLMPGSGLARDYKAWQQFFWRWVLPVLTLLPGNINLPRTSGKRLARLATGRRHKEAAGLYFEGASPIRSSIDSYNETFADNLWSVSETLCGMTNNPVTV
ncbi:MAG: hypothetical protein COA62_06275 [Rhodobiaceae bacterium]|nr:MAG: hypothetical protein COA62_06275 [Rhodobiaceae bacterium]